MLPNELDRLAYQGRYEDLLREADGVRLVGQVQSGQGRWELIYHRVLLWLGRRLVAWGWCLQERYGSATAAASLRAAKGTS